MSDADDQQQRRQITTDSLADERLYSDNALAQRDEFIAVLSHDLRNPISALLIGVSLLRQEAKHCEEVHCARIHERLDMMQRQLNNMMRMVNSLLDADAITAGRMPISAQKRDAVEDAHIILEEFRSLANHHHVNLDVKVPDRPLWVVYDDDRIRQVLGNLVGNAIKHAEKSSTIVITCRKDDDPDWARFEVFNKGEAIPEDMRKRIFERFVQVQNPSSSRSMGLGLWISKWIIAQHGGKIWTEPSDGGNSFVFTIPRAGLHTPGSPSTAPPT